MRVLIAPNAFKNSLTASDAAQAISNGLRKSSASFDCTNFPVGDGGDGTAAIFSQNWGGKEIIVEVQDPLGRIISASYGWIAETTTAIIELANASGLRLLKSFEYDPLRCNTFGTGELIKSALDRNASKIILCIGGSATVDGATGILRALGIRFLNSKGTLIANPGDLEELDDIDLSQLDSRLQKMELFVLCDVDNFLLGSNGAAAIFGPQKGADAMAVQRLDRALQRLQEITLEKTGYDMNSIKHGGAAGGVAAGLFAFLQARLENGIEYFLDHAGFDNLLDKSDLLITGEGSIDLQTLQGKAPYGVAKRAKKKNIPVIAFAGQVPDQPELALKEYFDLLLSINKEPVDLATALQNTSINLEEAAKALGERILLSAGNLSEFLG